MFRTPTTQRARGVRNAAAGALIAGVLVGSPFAVAATGDSLREGVRNGTTTSETEIIGDLEAKTGKGGYVTRQSNTRTGAGAGGAAIYGCRAPAGGTSGGSAPCLRASNLGGGNAFEFATSSGPFAGVISIGDPATPNPGAPFVTNATGVATGLNADKVDGKDASELVGATGPAGPQGPAGPTELRYEQINALGLSTCAGTNHVICPPVRTRTLGAGNWFVQAKLVVDNNTVAPTNVSNECGLTSGGTSLDEARHALDANTQPGQSESLALAGVVTGAVAGSTVELRCTEQAGETLVVEDVKLTAMKVETVVGP